MKVTGEMETKDREQKRQTGASCCATHEHHAPEHEHGLELREVLRVVFVALAARSGLVSPMGAISRGECDRVGRGVGRGLSHRQGGD